MRASSKDKLVERSLVALRRLAVEPEFAIQANELVAELEAAAQAPLTIGLVGDDIAARTRCIDALCGGDVLDALGRVPGCAEMRIRRGPQTRFRAIKSDGTVEERVQPVAPAGPRTRPPRPPPKPSPAVEEQRARVRAATVDADRKEQQITGLVRVRPHRWAFWMWIVRWFAMVFSRAKVAAARHAHDSLALEKAKLAELEDVVVIEESPAPREDSPAGFNERLRALGSGMLVGRGIRRIDLDVVHPLLPEGIVIVELALATPPGMAKVDEVVSVSGDRLYVIGDGSGAPRLLGELSDAIAQCPTVASEARARRIGRRARDEATTMLATLDDQLEAAAIDFRNRLAKLDTMRIVDPQRFATEQVTPLRPQLASSVNAVIEHGMAHLGMELSQLIAEWTRAIDQAATGDELKVAAARIDEESRAAMARIAEEVRILVMGGVGGAAHDLGKELLAPLRAHGLPEKDLASAKKAPALPPIDMMRRLATGKGTDLAAGGAGKWITGLFRSFDAKRTELRTRLTQHAERIQELATAELLDAEPVLTTALGGVVESVFAAAVDRQVEWLEAETLRERAAIAAEREQLAPITRLADGLRRDLKSIKEMIAEREEGRASSNVA